MVVMLEAYIIEEIRQEEERRRRADEERRPRLHLPIERMEDDPNKIDRRPEHGGGENADTEVDAVLTIIGLSPGARPTTWSGCDISYEGLPTPLRS